MRVVNSLDDLLQLPRDSRVNGLRARELLQLEIPALTRHALAGAQDALNSLQERGGASVAALVMLVVMTAGVAEVFYRNAMKFTLRSAGELVVVVAISFCIGAAAKFAALEFTRWQFAYRCRAQHRMLSMLLRGPTPQ